MSKTRTPASGPTPITLLAPRPYGLFNRRTEQFMSMKVSRRLRANNADCRRIDAIIHVYVLFIQKIRQTEWAGLRGSSGMRKRLAAGILACLTWSSVARADSRELRVAASFPVGHYLVQLMLKPGMDEVTKRTNGAG